MSNEKNSYKKWEVLLVVLLVGSVSLNLYLSREVRDLTRKNYEMKNEGRLIPGTRVPAIEATRLDGIPVAVDYGDEERPTLLYVFSPSCGWCERNNENIRALAAAVEESHRLIGLSLGNHRVAEYVAENDLRFPAFYQLSPETVETYKLGGTPQTLLISPDGDVLKNWMGAFSGDVEESIEKHFDIELPGLAERRDHSASAAEREPAALELG